MSAAAEEATCKILSAECKTKHKISCAAVNFVFMETLKYYD
jgi:hypothetical protein